MVLHYQQDLEALSIWTVLSCPIYKQKGAERSEGTSLLLQLLYRSYLLQTPSVLGQHLSVAPLCVAPFITVFYDVITLL